MDWSRRRLLSCHRIEREGGLKKKKSHLSFDACQNTETPIPVLFVNLLMDFDASDPIDHYRAHIGSWKFLVNNMRPVTPSYSP